MSRNQMDQMIAICHRFSKSLTKTVSAAVVMLFVIFLISCQQNSSIAEQRSPDSHAKSPTINRQVADGLDTPDESKKAEAHTIQTQISNLNNTDGIAIRKELEKEGVPIIAVIGSGKFFKLSTIGDVKGPGNSIDKIYLNFENADVPAITRMVIGEILGLEFDIDPDIKNTITFKTKVPISRQALLGEFQNVLADNNISLLEINRRIYIMSEAKRYSDNTPRLHGTQKIGDKSVLPIQLKYISATQIANLLQSVSTGEAKIQADTTRNIIIVSGTPQDILTVHEMIKMFDVDWLAGMSFALFPLSVADAGTVIFELEKIFEQQDSALTNVFKFIPLERLNAILVISKQPLYFERIAQWIKRLDMGEKQIGYGLHVYYLTNTKSSTVASMLQELFADGGIGISNKAPEPPKQTRSGPRISNSNSESKGRQNDDQRDDYYDQKSHSNVASVNTGNVKIIPDEENNALIIKSSATDYRMIEAAIKRLDLPPLQVMIEATIAEVSLTNELQYGINAFFDKEHFTGNMNGSGVASKTATALIDKGFKFIFKNQDIMATLKMLKEKTDVKVLSSPYAMVHNNKTVDMKVGKQVPVISTETTSNAAADAPTVTNIDFRDTGIMLTVTPRVSNDGKVTLDIIQEKTEADNAGNSNNSNEARLTPAFTDQKLNTIVTVQSGNTIALGGLISDTAEEGRSGVPLLMDIPILGRIFSTNTSTGTRKELLILVTPRIIKNDDDALLITDEFRERLQLAEKITFKGHKLFPQKLSAEDQRKLQNEMDEITKKYFDNAANRQKIDAQFDIAPSAYEGSSYKGQAPQNNQDNWGATDDEPAPEISSSTIHSQPRTQAQEPVSLLNNKATNQSPEPQPAPSQQNRVFIQTYDDRDLAEEEWIRLSRKFANKLDFSKIQVLDDNVTGKSYRLQSDDMDPQIADRFCNAMRESGEECTILKAAAPAR